MKITFFITGCICTYLIAGINPAIILSNLIHKQDIREYGSKNPGFTNYKRVFGGADAWVVFVLDLLKTIVPVLIFSLIIGAKYDMRQFSAQLFGLCAMIGHSYPIWYKFKGGKAFTTSMATIYIVDWRAGLIVTAVFLTLLFTVKFMSLSSISAGITAPIALSILGVDYLPTIFLSIVAALLLIWRHKANIVRLVHKEEKKFYLFKRNTKE
jgi:glycerol-3-phosphate acyltransferase PlsY